MVELGGGLLLGTGLLVRAAAVVLAVDMIGAIVVSGLGQGEYVSLTLAPALLMAMIFLIGRGSTGVSQDRPRPARARLDTRRTRR